VGVLSKDVLLIREEMHQESGETPILSFDTGEYHCHLLVVKLAFRSTLFSAGHPCLSFRAVRQIILRRSYGRPRHWELSYGEVERIVKTLFS